MAIFLNGWILPTGGVVNVTRKAHLDPLNGLLEACHPASSLLLLIHHPHLSQVYSITSPPPPHLRHNTPPPPHVRSYTPQHSSGRHNTPTPPHVRYNTPPPPHVRSNAPQHLPGRSNTPPPPHVKCNTPPPINVRSNTLPPPHVRSNTIFRLRPLDAVLYTGVGWMFTMV